MATKSAPSKSAAKILDYIRNGGQAYVSTSLRCTVLDKKTLAKFEKAGAPLLREEGEGYRIGAGKSSVYAFPGQLQVTA